MRYASRFARSGPTERLGEPTEPAQPRTAACGSPSGDHSSSIVGARSAYSRGRRQGAARTSSRQSWSMSVLRRVINRDRRLRTPDAERPVCTGDLPRIEARHEPEGKEPPIVRSQVGQRTLQVDEPDDACRIAPLVWLHRLGDVDDRSTASRPYKVTGLIGRDRDEPGPHLIRVSKRRESTPGDRPRRLDSIPSRLGVAADHECHAGHRLAMHDDETRECGLVALGGETNGRGHSRRFLHDQARHES